jgi:hypothetical protein
MLLKRLCASTLIIAGLALSLGCCCPGRVPFGPRPAPVVANQEPPLEPPPFVQPPEHVRRFIATNLGPNDREGALAPKSAFWERLRQVVEQRQYKRVDVRDASALRFEDLLPEGGVLIGFFAAEPESAHVGFLQPIYLTGQGEKIGQPYGECSKKPVQCLKAKPGYAVGALDLRKGGILDGISVTFMKVQGEKLDSADSYVSPWIGGKGGAPASYTSNGALVVGIHGSRVEHEFITPAGSVTTLSFLTLP